MVKTPSHACWLFVLICHLVLQSVNLVVKVQPPTTMELLMLGATMILNTCYSIPTATPLENWTCVLVQFIKRRRFHNNKRAYQHPVVVHSLAFGGRGCFFSNRGFKKQSRIFNATLGYPGEGPKKKTMTSGAAMTTTWADLVGPICIFLDNKWCDGELIEVRENHVLYSLSDTQEQFIVKKDMAYKLIRTRKVVKTTGKGEKYNGDNPLVFGPDGAGLYGRKIKERKDRPGVYRVEVKFKPQKTAKVQNKKINLGRHVRLSFAFLLCALVCLLNPVACCLLFLFFLQDSFESADSICDDKIREWLHNRKKHADPKRKRSRVKTDQKEHVPVVAREGNTPKRHTRSTRHYERVDSEVTKKCFSPVATSMFATPVVQHVQQKNKNRKKQNPNNKKNQLQAAPFDFVTFLLVYYLSVCLPIVVCLVYLLSFDLLANVVTVYPPFVQKKRIQLLRELKQKSKQAFAKRVQKRIDAYKTVLRTSLPSEIELWGARESRLLSIISGSAGLSNAVLLTRECPDPPVEIDPDTDEESKQTEATDVCETKKRPRINDARNTEDPTIRPWDPSDAGAHTHNSHSPPPTI